VKGRERWLRVSGGRSGGVGRGLRVGGGGQGVEGCCPFRPPRGCAAPGQAEPPAPRRGCPTRRGLANPAPREVACLCMVAHCRLLPGKRRRPLGVRPSSPALTACAGCEPARALQKRPQSRSSPGFCCEQRRRTHQVLQSQAEADCFSGSALGIADPWPFTHGLE
jgi:hypothetical protein